MKRERFLDETPSENILLKDLVGRLNHLDARERSIAFDSLLSAGPAAITYLVPLLNAKDVDTRIAALNLCCRLNPKGVKNYMQEVWVEDGDINVAVAMLEVLCIYGDSAGDLALVDEVVKRYRHSYTKYVGSLAAEEIRRRGRLIPCEKEGGQK